MKNLFSLGALKLKNRFENSGLPMTQFVKSTKINVTPGTVKNWILGKSMPHHLDIQHMERMKICAKGDWNIRVEEDGTPIPENDRDPIPHVHGPQDVIQLMLDYDEYVASGGDLNATDWLYEVRYDIDLCQMKTAHCASRSLVLLALVRPRFPSSSLMR